MFSGLRFRADIVVRRRFTVIGAIAAGLLALGIHGLGLGDHLSSSGWNDPGAESAQAQALKSEVFGRDHSTDVIVLYHAPPGKTVDDPDFARRIIGNLNELPRRYPNEIDRVVGAYWPTDSGPALPGLFGTPDRRHAFASIALKGEDDTGLMRAFRSAERAFDIPGIDLEVAGGQPVGVALTDTMAEDQRRMELFAIPVVALLLFVVFGGAIAASLPLIAGGLSVLGAWGALRLLTTVMEVNSFVSPVVSMIGLGLAVDYGLLMVNRFREELADGADPPTAVMVTVRTAGFTVASSAGIVIVAACGVLVYPQPFLRSFAFGAIITISFAALTSITLLPACLAVLGRRVDAFGLARLRARATTDPNIWLSIADRMTKRPVAVTVSLCAGLLLLIAPMQAVSFGGITERFLPPDYPTRLAQQHFDELFPSLRIDPIELVIISDSWADAVEVRARANQAPGLAAPFPALLSGATRPDVHTTSAALLDPRHPDPAIDHLRSMPLPAGTTLLVGGAPTAQQDSVHTLLRRTPLMIALVLTATTLMMFVAFGSLVLPLKAAVLNTLGLGSTLGILTLVFVEGRGAGLLNFTPQPMMALILVLIIAVIYGLSTDYEVFLLSRMVEARARGATTAEAIRAGIGSTGRIITTAALVLLAVTGAFAFSDLVMMKYVACGMVAALLIDVTVIRLMLVPAVMTLLGDRCWWAPAWTTRLRHRGAPPPATSDLESAAPKSL